LALVAEEKIVRAQKGASMRLLRNVLVAAFGLLMLVSASYVVFMTVDPLLGYPWSVLAATAAFMGAMAIVDRSRPFLRISEEWAQRKIEVEDRQQRAMMTKLLRKKSLLPPPPPVRRRSPRG
jgi:hypothetical protein